MSVRDITSADQEWPALLNEMGVLHPPRRLFAEGLPLRNETKAVAVVGTRRPTAAGVEATEHLTRGLVEAGFTIVSGLAMGIDAVAHRTALRLGGYTIAVLGTGLDVIYPKRNRTVREEIIRRGTLLTEFPEGTQPLPHHFPARNRIVAGLSTGVLVIEGSYKSGALITARLAIDANRSVWALPGSFRNPMADGPNELIRTGQAALVTQVQHIFEDLSPSLVWGEDTGTRSPIPDLKPEEIVVLQALDDAPIPVDRLARVTALPAGTVALSASRIEVRGLASRRGAGYELTDAGARVRKRLATE